MNKKILGIILIVLGVLFFTASFYDPFHIAVGNFLDVGFCSFISIFCAIPASAFPNLIFIFISALLGLFLTFYGIMMIAKEKKEIVV